MTETAPVPEASVVRVDEIQWLRIRRHTAVTEADHAAIRSRLQQLAHDLGQRPDPVSPLTFVAIAVGVVLAGFALGWGLYVLADSMWVWLNS